MTRRAPRSWFRVGFVVAFVATGFIIYGNTLSRPLGSDARFLTDRNAFVTDPGGFGKFWTADFFEGAITNGVTYQSGYYRPVTNANFWLEYRFGGSNPAFYRISQLLLHCLTALLVVAVCRRLTNSAAAGLIAGSLFLLHPVNAFAATEPAARADVLLPVFYLGGLLTFDAAQSAITARARWSWASAAALCCALATLTKEPGITLPAVLVLLVLLRRYRDDRSWHDLTLTLPAWGTASAYLVWRFGVLGLTPPSFGYTAEHSSALLVLATIKGIAIHGSRIFMPLGAQYPELNPRLVNYVDTTMTDPLTYVSVAIVLGLIVLALGWRRMPLLAFWAGFFLVTLSPLLRIDNIQGTLSTNEILIQERWIYLSAIAVFAVVGWGAALTIERSRSLRHRAALIAGAVVLSMFLGRSAAIHAGKHDDPFAQLQRLYLFPEDRLSRLQQANKLMLYARWVATPMGDLAEAETRTREAVRLVPDSPIAAASLAQVLSLTGRWQEVVTVLESWLAPSMPELEQHHATNVRVGDDLNRVAPTVALLLTEARVHLGPGDAAGRLLCESARRNADVERIRRALQIGFARFGPSQCHRTDDPEACTIAVDVPSGQAWRPPFVEASCHVWMETLTGDDGDIAARR